MKALGWLLLGRLKPKARRYTQVGKTYDIQEDTAALHVRKSKGWFHDLFSWREGIFVQHGSKYVPVDGEGCYEYIAGLDLHVDWLR